MGAYDYPAGSPEGLVMGGKYPAFSPEAAVMNGSRPAPPKVPVDMSASNAALKTQAAANPSTTADDSNSGPGYSFSALAKYANSIVSGLSSRGGGGSAGDPNYGNEGRAPVKANTPAEQAAAQAAADAVDPKNKLGNYGNGADVGPAQPLPGFDKASGMAAIAAGGGPRELNVGSNTPIYGESVNGSKKLNSFYGPGAGPVPFGVPNSAAAGAAGTPGSGAAADPFQQATAHLVETMNQAKALRERGDISGALQARGLESHALRMSQLFTALGQHGYQQGMLGNQRTQLMGKDAQGNPTLAGQEASFKVNTQDAIQKLLAVGTKEALAQAEVLRHLIENTPAHPIAALPPFTTVRDLDAGKNEPAVNPFPK